MSYRVQRECVGGSWRLLLTLACILLVVIAGTVQVAHSHDGRADTRADCSLCAASHATIHPVQAPIPVPTVTVIAVLEAIPHTVVPSVLTTFALFTRPPPVVDIVPA
jgi:hypothetical protein